MRWPRGVRARLAGALVLLVAVTAIALGVTTTVFVEARLRQQAIGVKLRHMFDEVVNEPVPDEFLDILRRADQRDEGTGGA